MVPWASESVSGNWLALRGPRRSGLYHEATPCNSKLLLRLGSKTPTSFPSLVLVHADGKLEVRVVRTTLRKS